MLSSLCFRIVLIRTLYLGTIRMYEQTESELENTLDVIP
jgi:hypothetical protein